MKKRFIFGAPLIALAVLVYIWQMEAVFTLVLLTLTGYYIYVSKIVHLKGSGELKKDILLSIFWIILIWYGFCLKFLVPSLKSSPLAGKFPGWVYLVVELCFVFLTFRAAAEGIAITKRRDEDGKKKEGKEDPGLFLIKVSAEMIGIFLLFPVTFIYVSTGLGVRWWELISGSIGGLIFGIGLGWCIVIYILPGTYKSAQAMLKLIAPLVLVFLIAISCWVNGRQAGLPFGPNLRNWNPKEESVFEYFEYYHQKQKKQKKEEKAERKKIIRFRSAPAVIPVLPGRGVRLEMYKRPPYSYRKMIVARKEGRDLLILQKLSRIPNYYYNSNSEILYLYLYTSL